MKKKESIPKNKLTSPPSSHNLALYVRLTEFIEYKGDNYVRLARSLDRASTYFQGFKTKKAPISSETVMKILLHYPDLSAEWLLRGTGTMLIGTVHKDEVDYYRNVETTTTELQEDLEKLIKDFDKQLATIDRKNKKLFKVRNKKIS